MMIQTMLRKTPRTGMTVRQRASQKPTLLLEIAVAELACKPANSRKPYENEGEDCRSKRDAQHCGR
jgi:hypothetical protein